MKTETAINALIQRSGGTPQPEDYFGADGLLYCGKCNTPKQAFFEGHKRVPILGDRHPVECQCRRVEREKQEAIIRRLNDPLYTVEFLKEWVNRNDNVFINAPAALQAMGASGFFAAVRAIERAKESDGENT